MNLWERIEQFAGECPKSQRGRPLDPNSKSGKAVIDAGGSCQKKRKKDDKTIFYKTKGFKFPKMQRNFKNLGLKQYKPKKTRNIASDIAKNTKNNIQGYSTKIKGAIKVDENEKAIKINYNNKFYWVSKDLAKIKKTGKTRNNEDIVSISTLD